ncbi:MAG TPA: bifunctional adenosylcobinamide kinase/adenosylcobinamide-phosphate guanylyltransferase [Streptosporangiaceae bacterium]|nr:bifunctional adenosylcobinamide kinase/adenosylcobinamide-phosphate guanylyltransferase [Streptosporangiaceae bacterium]
MQVELLGTAGPLGWPAPGCRCASCARMRSAGRSWEPTRIVVDGVPLERCPGRDVPGGRDARPPGGGRLLVAAGPGARPEPAEPGAYDAVLLDLIGAPEHLARLRREGTVTARTNVRAIHNDHRVSSPAELVRRLGWWTAPLAMPRRTLVIGGARSGKSAEAELRLAAHPEVTYVATGPGDPEADPEWAARVAAHRARRPPWWTTLETTDLAEVLRTARDALLIDGIGTWLAAIMDETHAWDTPDAVLPRLDDLVDAWRATQAHVVAVSDEVGLAVVPATPAGRAFRDLLGRLNQRLAAESEEAILVVAGRAVELPA